MHFFRSPLVARILFPGGLWKGKDKNAVYLTFDDGPNPHVTPWVLELLKRQEIKATFFLVGNNIKQNPELVAKIESEGHRIGNHTMNHERGTKTKLDVYLNSVNEVDRLINTDLFRPPYGRISFWQFLKLLKNGKKIIFWSWLSYDFDNQISTEKIIEKAKKIKGGDILVFHDSEKSFSNLKGSIEKIICEIKAKNLSFKTL